MQYHITIIEINRTTNLIHSGSITQLITDIILYDWYMIMIYYQPLITTNISYINNLDHQPTWSSLEAASKSWSPVRCRPVVPVVPSAQVPQAEEVLLKEHPGVEEVVNIMDIN